MVGLAGCIGARVAASDQPPTETNENIQSGDVHDDGEHDHSPTEHGSGHGHAHDDEVPEAADAVTFRMTTTDSGEHFEPHVLWLNVGGTATWVNESGLHSATAYHSDNEKPLLMPEAARSFDSGILTEPDAEFSHTFDTEGVYHFYCAPHESLGMIGSLIVGHPDPHDQVALGEIPSSLPETARAKIEHLNEKCNEALGHEH